jgi:hypothetical protein
MTTAAETFLRMNKTEVWKAVEETGDKRLQARVKNAYSIIERTLALYK